MYGMTLLRRTALAAFAVACTMSCGTERESSADTNHWAAPVGPWKKVPRRARPSDEQLKRELTPVQYDITRQDGTEPPFHNEYWDNHASGIYVDIITGEPLFTSLDKFDSGTGWPSFTRPISGDALRKKTDTSDGMVRDEVRSKLGDDHLGHVFDDGPAPTGLRYCIDSAALRFIPADQLANAGYPEYAASFAKK
jgi:methionine-R-sulfoxide reductase